MLHESDTAGAKTDVLTPFFFLNIFFNQLKHLIFWQSKNCDQEFTFNCQLFFFQRQAEAKEEENKKKGGGGYLASNAIPVSID